MEEESNRLVGEGSLSGQREEEGSKFSASKPNELIDRDKYSLLHRIWWHFHLHSFNAAYGEHL